MSCVYVPRYTLYGQVIQNIPNSRFLRIFIYRAAPHWVVVLVIPNLRALLRQLVWRSIENGPHPEDPVPICPH